MGHKKWLNQNEIDHILSIRCENYYIAKIAKLLNRSRKDLLKNLNQYGKKRNEDVQ